ncbi:hypothetical protein BGX31_000616 [Mortierella sp. GBA43]|nr:hypothetical protein BGX31_000616 [Mortierella sp. GBA43]
MIIQGAAMLLPWNVFITAQSFFKLKFTGSPYEQNFQNYFSVAFMGTNLMVVGGVILIQKQAPGTTFIIGSLILNAAVFLSILISIQITYQVDPTTYFFFVLSMLSLSAISTSIVQNGVFGLASKFTGFHVQGVMVGQGVAGAGVAISQIVSQILSPPKDGAPTYSYDVDSMLLAGPGGHPGGGGHRRKSEGVEGSAFLFFSFALCFTVISILAQGLLVRLPIYEYYTEDQPRQPIEFLAPPSANPPRRHEVVIPGHGPAGGSHAHQGPAHARRSSVASGTSNVTTATVTQAMVEDEHRRQAEEEAAIDEQERINHFRSASLGSIVLADDAHANRLMQDIYPKRRARPLLVLYISITLVFALTLSVYPSLTGLVESTNTDRHRSRIFGDLFVPLHFLTFNLGDWLGRSLPSIPWFAPDIIHPTRKQQLRYMFSGLLRFFFIPIFLATNLPIPADKRLLPLLVQRDEVWFFLMFLFATTNGYLVSVIMMVGPACVLGGEKKAIVGVRLGFWLTAGLAIGSAASFGVRKLMCARGGCLS